MSRSGLNSTSQMTRLPFVLLIVVIVLWCVGGLAFQFSLWPFAGMFGPTADLQNVFSPVGALFSGVAVWGAIYTIYIQTVMTNRQQFESVFFNLLNIHNENKRNLRFPLPLEGVDSEKNIIGDEAFLRYYRLLKNIYSYVFRASVNNDVQCSGIGQEVLEEVNDNLGHSRDENMVVKLNDKDLFRLTYDIYTQYTDPYYSNYARHIYHTLKYVCDNASAVKDKRIYIRMLRAQLSIHEAALLYYRAITSEDKRNGANKSKYQELIEKTSFLHLLCDDMSMLFDNYKAGQMDDSAFDCNHVGLEA